MLTPVFDPHFHDCSFGFRPGCSAHQAVERARQSIADGAVWVVDVATASAAEQISVALGAEAPVGSTPNGLALSPAGRPYINAPAASLAPGASSSFQVLFNKTGPTITYSTEVWAGPGAR